MRYGSVLTERTSFIAVAVQQFPQPVLFLLEINDVRRRLNILLLIAASLLLPSFGSAQTMTPDLRNGSTGSAPAGSRWSDLSRLPPARAPQSQFGYANAASNFAPVQGETFELAETVAQVGNQYILKGDLIGEANLIMAPMWNQLAKAPPEAQEPGRRELFAYRERLVEEQLLPQAIERKLKFLSFMRGAPTENDPKKLAEREKRMQQNVNKKFDEELEKMISDVRAAKPEEYPELAKHSQQHFRIAIALKEAGIDSYEGPAVEQLLSGLQTSLAKQRAQFLEYATGQQDIASKIDLRPEITHAQMVAYYREHESEYWVPMMAEWEQMSVLFKRMPDVPAAWDQIVLMGNQVLFGGAPFWAVAQRESQEKNASKGGKHDWTSHGDLKLSRPINEAVFSIELNRLSQIIEDDEGLHIIRVLGRQEAHMKPFEDVQHDIKDKLRTEMINKSYAEYLKKLREQTPVITDFGTEASGNRYAKPAVPGSMSR